MREEFVARLKADVVAEKVLAFTEELRLFSRVHKEERTLTERRIPLVQLHLHLPRRDREEEMSARLGTHEFAPAAERQRTQRERGARVGLPV